MLAGLDDPTMTIAPRHAGRQLPSGLPGIPRRRKI
jgi:hypothetical protein